MKKLKATGIAVAASLLLLAVIMGAKRSPGANISDSAGLSTRGAADTAPVAPRPGIICAGCGMPEAPSGTPSGSQAGVAMTAADTSSLKLERQLVSASMVQMTSGGSAADSDSGDGAAPIDSAPLVPATVAGGGAGSNGIGANGDRPLSITGDTGGTAIVSGDGGGTGSPGDDLAGAGNDVIASIGPGTAGRDDPTAPDLGYCINPVGAYCGAEPQVDALLPGAQKEGSDPPPPAAGLVPDNDSGQKSEPGGDSSRDTPNTVPEPAMLALIGIGLAGLGAVRRTGR